MQIQKLPLSKFYSVLLFLLFLQTTIAIAMSTGKIKTLEVSYQDKNGELCKGFVAYDSSTAAKLPVVLVLPEWWGCGEYVRLRATQLAALGYLAFAVDVYGDGKIANSVADAQAFSAPFYKDIQLAINRIEAAQAAALLYPNANPQKIAAIGYCFGGGILLEAVRNGYSCNGVVSFHGSLPQSATIEGAIHTPMLICHGAADKFVSNEQVTVFKNNLDKQKIPYTFYSYAGATMHLPIRMQPIWVLNSAYQLRIMKLLTNNHG